MSKPKSAVVLAVILAVVAGLAASATPADPIRIAYIDPLSGPFAATGESGLNQFKYAADAVNKAGGVLGRQIEIVPLDNKASPQESLIQLKKVIGDSIPFVFQGNSSGVAHAISDAVQKHNERNAGNRILYLNYSAVDPALTNEKCHFWHFRFDAHADMKMAALTDVIATNKSIKKMYIIGQDYSFGKAVAEGAVSMLGKKRPDIQIVGNELHPIGKVKDFSPYVQKIIASGADAVITGNWGADMVATLQYPVDFYVPSENALRAAVSLYEEAPFHDRAAAVALPPARWACRQRVPANSGSGTQGSRWPLVHPLFVALDLAQDPARGREILATWEPEGYGVAWRD